MSFAIHLNAIQEIMSITMDSRTDGKPATTAFVEVIDLEADFTSGTADMPMSILS